MKKLFLALAVFALAPLLFAEARNALLIAEGKYKNFGSLATPESEAKNLKKALEKLNFDVKIIVNANKETILDELYDFEKKVQKAGGVAFFHYGGHAVQVKGKNYLIPVDADIPDESRVATRAVDADEVMECMKGDTNIIILDACRNNPLPAASGRSATRGLVMSDIHPRNSVLVYSAQPGKVAQDGVFTPILTEKILLKESFSQILMEVRKEVRERTKYEQNPGEYNELETNIYLAGLNEAKPVHAQEVEYALTGGVNPFEDETNFFVNKSKGDMDISIEDVKFEGKIYKALSIKGSTGPQESDWSDWWGVSCQSNDGGMVNFLQNGNNIKFKCVGDGRVWRMTLRLVGYEYKTSSFYIYEFPTKNGQVTEVVIPYSKFKFDKYSPKKYNFDKDQITAVEIFAYNPGSNAERSLKIFDARVF